MEAVSLAPGPVPRVTAAERSRVVEYLKQFGKDASIVTIIEVIKGLIMTLL